MTEAEPFKLSPTLAKMVRERHSAAKVAMLFDLGASGGSDIARDKDAMIAAAFASLRRKGRRRST